MTRSMTSESELRKRKKKTPKLFMNFWVTCFIWSFYLITLSIIKLYIFSYKIDLNLNVNSQNFKHEVGIKTVQIFLAWKVIQLLIFYRHFNTFFTDIDLFLCRTEYLFNFEGTFEVHDDIEVLKRMGLSLGEFFFSSKGALYLFLLF